MRGKGRKDLSFGTDFNLLPFMAVTLSLITLLHDASTRQVADTDSIALGFYCNITTRTRLSRWSKLLTLLLQP